MTLWTMIRDEWLRLNIRYPNLDIVGYGILVGLLLGLGLVGLRLS